MPDYAAQIRAEDRWAIIAYIRALQLSGHATRRDGACRPPRRIGSTGAAGGATVMRLSESADVAIPELAGAAAPIPDRSARPDWRSR